MLNWHSHVHPDVPLDVQRDIFSHTVTGAGTDQAHSLAARGHPSGVRPGRSGYEAAK